MPDSLVAATNDLLADSDASLRSALLGRPELRGKVVLHEMSLPADRLRADLAVITTSEFVGYEIKSAADRLTRLPKQIIAYQDIFDLCLAVVAPRHLDQVFEVLPPWWGIMTTNEDGSALQAVRTASRHGRQRPEIMVRLLWRDEAAVVVQRHGLTTPRNVSRSELWRTLVTELDLSHLKVAVATALAERSPASARIPTRWSRLASV